MCALDIPCPFKVDGSEAAPSSLHQGIHRGSDLKLQTPRGLGPGTPLGRCLSPPAYPAQGHSPTPPLPCLLDPGQSLLFTTMITTTHLADAPRVHVAPLGPGQVPGGWERTSRARMKPQRESNLAKCHLGPVPSKCTRIQPSSLPQAPVPQPDAPGHPKKGNGDQTLTTLGSNRLCAVTTPLEDANLNSAHFTEEAAEA